MKRYILLVPLILAGVACRADPAAETAYARLNSRLLAVKSLTGTLEMTHPAGKSTFRVQLLRPNYYSTVSDDYEAHCDGKTDWSYMRMKGQYDSRPATKEMSPGAPLVGFEALFTAKAPKDYSAEGLFEATFAGKRCQKIILTPRDDATSKMRLYLDASDGLPAGWIMEISGPDPADPPQRITGVYRDLRLDAPLTARAFAWKPPKGVKKYDPNTNLLKVGSVAPAFTLNTPEGTRVSLVSTLKKNKATLVNFWFYG